MRVDNSARSGGIIRISLIFYNLKVCCVFSLESPHRGDSNEYKQHTIGIIKRKITRNYPKYNNVCSCGIFFLFGNQEQVRNSLGKRAISVRATEVLLYFVFILTFFYCFLDGEEDLLLKKRIISVTSLQIIH